MTLGVYKFEWDCGRMGEISGIFVADSEDVKKAIGRHVYFGEVLGKHSEIYGDLEENEISLLTDDEIAVKIFEQYGFATGYNPILRIEERDSEDED